MATKRYEVTGRPAVPFDVLIDHQIGDVVETDLDRDQEEFLVSVGALRVLPDERKSSSDSKEPAVTTGSTASVAKGKELK